MGKCSQSNKRWGCPAEWQKALTKKKRLFLLVVEEEQEEAKQNEDVKEILRKLQVEYYDVKYHVPILEHFVRQVKHYLQEEEVQALPQGVHPWTSPEMCENPKSRWIIHNRH